MGFSPWRAASLLLLFFVTAASGELLFSRRVYKQHGASYQQIWSWNPATGALKPLTNSPRDHYNPTCDGRIIRFTSRASDADRTTLWTLNSVSGKESVIGPAPEPKEAPQSMAPGCNQFAKAGALEACGAGETLVVSRSGKQIGHFQIQVNTCDIDSHGTIGKCETPIRSLAWSHDGKWLLIGEEGVNDGSGRRQDDYYLVNIATMKLRTVASAEIAFWLPGRDQIVYVTPFDLAPLPGSAGKHSVWVQQLMSFDPLKAASTAITSGLTDSRDPSWCERQPNPHQ